MSTRLLQTASVIATIAATVAGCAPGRELPSFAVVTSGVSAPRPTATSIGDVELPSYPSGAREKLAALRGKVVLVDVWATYCAPCKESLPALQSFAEEMRGQPFELVTVNIDETEAPIKAFLAEQKLALRVLRDPEAAQLKKVVRLSEAPTSIVLDQEGKVRFVHAGTNAEIQSLIRSEVRDLIAKSGGAQ